jgi:hypothetical protein
MRSHSRGKRIPQALALLLVLVAAIAVIPSIGYAQKAAKKLTKQDVIDLLTGDVPSDQVAQEARKSGIAFQVTTAVVKEIHDAGGTDDLIRVLKTLGPGAPAAPGGTAHTGAATSAPTLTIVSNPGKSQVYVDDEPVGSTSQQGRLKLTQLSAGDHRVRISLSGYQDHEETVTLAGGQSHTVTATLERAEQPSAPPSPQAPQTVETPPVNSGQPGILGVVPMDQQPAGARGVVISGTFPGTPAERAGLKAYDTILGVNGRQVTTLQEIHDAVLGHQVGESVQVTWYNGSKNVTKQIQLVAAPAQGQATVQPPSPPSPTNMPQNGMVSFIVAHDHGRSGQDYCVGVMSIGNGMIYYKGNKGNTGVVHNFEIPLNTVKEARRNLGYLVGLGAFHIHTRSSKFNFVVLNQQGQYMAPDAILTAIDNAMGR